MREQIAHGRAHCTFEGLVREDHLPQRHGYAYNNCRLNLDAHGNGTAPADHRSLPLRLVGKMATGPEFQPFQPGEHLVLQVERAPFVPRKQTRPDDPDRPEWFSMGIGATVVRVLSRYSSAATARHRSLQSASCGYKCVGPRKILTIAQKYDGKGFCNENYNDLAELNRNQWGDHDHSLARIMHDTSFGQMPLHEDSRIVMAQMGTFDSSWACADVSLAGSEFNRAINVVEQQEGISRDDFDHVEILPANGVSCAYCGVACALPR